jgi:hypothetical protein
MTAPQEEVYCTRAAWECSRDGVCSGMFCGKLLSSKGLAGWPVGSRIAKWIETRKRKGISMRPFIILIGLGIFVLPAQAQTMGVRTAVRASGGGGGGTGTSATRSLPSLPATRFAVIVTAGSNATFEPSAFVPYNQAVEAGATAPKAAVFMNFREALAAGRAQIDGQSTPMVRVADGMRNETRSKTSVTFIQDQSGRVVKID